MKAITFPRPVSWWWRIRAPSPRARTYSVIATLAFPHSIGLRWHHSPVQAVRHPVSILSCDAVKLRRIAPRSMQSSASGHPAGCRRISPLAPGISHDRQAPLCLRRRSHKTRKVATAVLTRSEYVNVANNALHIGPLSESPRDGRRGATQIRTRTCARNLPTGLRPVKRTGWKVPAYGQGMGAQPGAVPPGRD